MLDGSHRNPRVQPVHAQHEVSYNSSVSLHNPALRPQCSLWFKKKSPRPGELPTGAPKGPPRRAAYAVSGRPITYCALPDAFASATAVSALRRNSFTDP